MFAHDVLKTIYSPVRAFEDIVRKPDIKGPLFILLLVLIVTAGLQYASATKVSDEEPMISRDEWTESVTWIAQWTSNGELARDADEILGNYSFASFVANNATAWMKLTGIGSFNCSSQTGYERLSFWIKWGHQDEMSDVPNATLKVSSGNGDDFFELDIGSKLSNSSAEWRIVKADLGPNSEGWVDLGSPKWENITGLELRLIWPSPANLTMKLDDLYFAKFAPLIVYFFTGWFGSVMTSALGFFILWGLYGGALLLVIKLVFGEKVGAWKTLFVVVGYLFSVRIVYLVVTVVLLSALPNIRLENLAQVWYPTLPYQVMLYSSFVTDVWMAALCAIAVRSYYSFTWKKAIGIAVLAGLLTFTLRPLIPI